MYFVRYLLIILGILLPPFPDYANGDISFRSNVCKYLPNYTVSHSRGRLTSIIPVGYEVSIGTWGCLTLGTTVYQSTRRNIPEE
jgi:hypothetical protein